ncbi:hypothetical protein AB1E22_00285 [Buttiauxella gaviniae]|uniref:Membrane protein, TIGR04086 family n=1 Tax=Buttiauxella gaviniae TaxID=82990 RepID=A0ABV3NNR4_9ENTR
MTNYQTAHREHDDVVAYKSTRNIIRLSVISWGAVFAGVIISMLVYLALIILGTSIGLSTIDPLKEQNPLEGIGIGAAIWTGLSMLIAIAAGGFISGWLARREGSLHGVLMFGVNTLICVWFMFVIANGAMTGALSVLGSGIQAAGSGISAAAPGITEQVKKGLDENNINLGSLQNELETTLAQTGNPDSSATAPQNNGAANNTGANDIAGFLKGISERDDSTFQPADREALKNIIIKRTGKTDAEADQIVAQTEKSYQDARAKYEELKKQAEQKAREAGEKAAKATARASWFAFFMLIVEAVLAGAMGKMGSHTKWHSVREEYSR